MEAMREDPHHARLRLLAQSLEAASVGLEVERERGPLVAFPVGIEVGEQ
jgi:hypothetical protein